MLTTAIGFAGMGLILTAFFMIETGRWKPHSPLYDSFNLAGGLLLVLYAWLIRSWPFLFLNVAWCAVAWRDMLHSQRGVEKKPHHLSHKRRTRQ